MTVLNFLHGVAPRAGNERLQSQSADGTADGERALQMTYMDGEFHGTGGMRSRTSSASSGRLVARKLEANIGGRRGSHAIS